MEANDFTEVATPILANSSPEGARDFLIPSRVHAGKFYALPQAPQQFKQLLMVGGVPRYYQLSACFRDEDPRADRLYGEFYQLDLEMSFVDDGEEVRTTTEPLIKQLVTDFAGKKLLTEDIPRIPYVEAMEKYGVDKPDLRYGMELIELSDVLQNSGFGVFANAIKDGGAVKAICVKGASVLSRSQIDNFTEIAKSEGAGGLAYLTFEAGEIKSPIAKFLSPEEIQAIREKTGAADGDIVFFGADKRPVINKVLGRLRIEFADHFKLKDPNVVALAWIVDFPFYEWDDKQNKLDFGHNPFSMPRGGVEALDVGGGVGLGVPEGLRLLERFRVGRPAGVHPVENEVRGPVDDSEHPSDPVADEGLAQRADERHRPGHRGLEVEVDAVFLRGREQGLGVLCEQCFVRGDDAGAVFEGGEDE